MTTNSSFGFNLRALRRARGLNQRDVATAIGVHPVTVSNWERDEALPDDETILKLATLLDVAAGELRYADLSDVDDVPRLRRRDPWIVAVGDRLRKLRQGAGLDALEVSLQVRGQGFAPNDLLEYEAGEGVLRVPALMTLARIYNVDPWWIWTGETWEDYSRRNRLSKDDLPREARLIREEMLLRWERAGANERDVAFMRAMLSGQTIRRGFEDAFGRRPTESDFSDAVRDFLKPIEREIIHRERRQFVGEVMMQVDHASAAKGLVPPEAATEDWLRFLVGLVEERDSFFRGQAHRVTHFSRVIAQATGLDRDECRMVERVAGFINVGRIHKRYDSVFNKPDRLTPTEWEMIKEQNAAGEILVETVEGLRGVAHWVGSKSENWDGTGYPNRLADRLIPIASRIFRAAETIDAMTSDRPYRTALTEAQIRAEFVRVSGRQFDPAIAEFVNTDSGWKMLMSIPEASQR